MWNYELMLKETFEEALMLNQHPEADWERLYNKLVANSLK